MRISDWSSDVCSSDLFYLDNRLVAEQQHPSSTHSTARAGQAHRVFSPTRRYIYAQHVLVGVIDYTESTLYWVHSDLIGAPRLVTDSHREIRWQIGRASCRERVCQYV